MPQIATIPDWERAAREMREMHPPVHYREIAEIVGLSYTTVWNALNRAAAKEHSKRHNERQTEYRRNWNAQQTGRHKEMRRERESKRIDLRVAQVIRHARRRGCELDEFDVIVLLRDPCAYCGEPATGVDHIVPVSAGGGDAADNLTAACGDCNRLKNKMPLLRFLRHRLEAADA